MPVPEPLVIPNTAAPARSFWQRRFADPILAQLTQGLTPQKIAFTISVGSSIAMFPILGTTTLICLLVGIAMKLNQPVIQVVNYGCTPIHFPFIYFAFRWGDQLFGDSHTSFELGSMVQLLREHPLEFVSTYSVTAVHATFVWAVLVPFWAVGVYFASLPLLRALDRSRHRARRGAATDEASA